MILRAWLLLAAATACASAPAAPNDAVAPTSNPVLQLWPGVAPGSENARQIEKVSTVPFSLVRNVVVPTLTVYLPEAGKATGTGVIIAPGGAFRFLSIDSEGHDVARWLVERGIAAFVLKYRVIETPQSDEEMWAELRNALSKPHAFDFDEDAKLGIADGLQAMKVVHERAHEWGLSADRIGFMGFSAGAMITSHVELRAPERERPAFAAPIYGAPLGEMPPIASSLPPIFLAYASDDTLVGPRVDAFYRALTAAGQHPELHVYNSGGHGFGMRKQGKSSDYWIEDFYHWLESLGLSSQKSISSR
jgi:acetyl esterase/lipase